MSHMEKKMPKAIDLSHHLSEVAKAREASPLKGLMKYFGKPGMISLAGGLPDPSYFPTSAITVDAQVPDSFQLTPDADSSVSWFWKLLGYSSRTERTERYTIPKFTSSLTEVNLATALQYGTATGLVPLQKFQQEFTQKVFQPKYQDVTTLAHAGNTDGWAKVLSMLCNPGELYLTEEWTYPSAKAAAKPLGVSPVPIKMDGEGMRSDDLRKVLAEWDEVERGAPRPHIMYTVPVGQNPTGMTMGATRKKEIYDICVEYDIIIVEDDPYYFLQAGTYHAKAERSSTVIQGGDEDAAFIASLAPSYLKFDYQGRVIRLDTFSKTIAPGSRLGWVTCNPVFAERLERQGETSTQAPCGFSQAIITQLLTKEWGYHGYIRWLRGIRAQYMMRRDFMVDCIAEEFHLTPTFITNGSWSGSTGYVARAKSKANKRGNFADEKHTFGSKALFTFVPPTSGMFVWVKVAFENVPSYSPEEQESLEQKLWVSLSEAGLLVGPGWIFSATGELEFAAPGHLRMSFSNGEFDTMKKAIGILSKVLSEFFEQ